MTDLAVEDQPSGEVGGGAAATAGGLLKQARELRQMDVAVLASVLKVSEHKIRALEANDLSALPDLAFARSLAASLARTLEIEPAPVLALLPKAVPSVSRVAHEPLNAPYHLQSEGGVLGRAFSALQSRYLWVVLALLLAAVVLALLPKVKEESLAAEGSVVGGPVGGMVTRDVRSPANPLPSAVDGVVAGVPAMPLSLDGPASAPASSASASLPAAGASAPVVGASAALPVGAASAPVASGDLQLSTTQDSWIQVQDSTGKTLFSRILKPGEAAGLSGVAPYKLVVGSVTGVTLLVRGNAFDLATAAKGGTTARFSVP